MLKNLVLKYHAPICTLKIRMGSKFASKTSMRPGLAAREDLDEKD